MTQRERNLALAVVAIIVGYGGWLGYGSWQKAYDDRVDAKTTAEIALADAQLREAMAVASTETLEIWQEKSLPSNSQVAQSQYRAWLVDQFEAANLEFETIRLVSSRPRGDAYTALTFTSDAEGDLAGVTRFLHAFYSTPTAHKLTQLKLMPMEPKGRLRMTIAVEALIVDGTVRETGLPDAEANRLALNSVDDYLASIGDRNLFVEYTPPPPPAPPKVEPKIVEKPPAPPKPKFDEAEQAYLTAVVQSGDRLQAWITVRTKGESLRLFAGDPVKVGLLEGVIESVSQREIVIKTEDASTAVSLGKHLREGRPVANPSNDPAKESEVEVL